MESLSRSTPSAATALDLFPISMAVRLTGAERPTSPVNRTICR